MNTGHGHVHPRSDGVKARCGGPGMCSECSMEAAREWGALKRDAERYKGLRSHLFLEALVENFDETPHDEYYAAQFDKMVDAHLVPK